MTINNVISANTTMGSLQIPTGFTLDKPYMDIPYGAVITGSGAVSTDGAITGAGILATTGTVLSRGVAPTQPKYDRIGEATAGKSVVLPNGAKIRGGTGSAAASGDIGEVITFSSVQITTSDNGWIAAALLNLPLGVWDIRGEVTIPHSTTLTQGVAYFCDSNWVNIARSVYGQSFLGGNSSEIGGQCVTICGGVVNNTVGFLLLGRIFVRSSTPIAGCRFTGHAIRIA
jgi:hypothetical protein